VGVYDGEEGKQRDYGSSLPPHLCAEHLLPHLRRGGRAVVLAEEWHTVNAVQHLDHLLRSAGLRERVVIFWNANNCFGFERIDWSRLRWAAVITTVSRYMKQRMWSLGVDPVAIPNGAAQEAFERPTPEELELWKAQFAGRVVLGKVARFDPDKRWLSALEITSQLRTKGLRPLLIARGGVEPYARQVLQRAAHLGLRVADCRLRSPGSRGLLDALAQHAAVDVVNVTSFLDGRARRLMYGASAAVLANSSHEPFGLVGLETMAVGGLACTGSTGEEYAHSGRNALVLQTDDPSEFVGLFLRLRADPVAEHSLRRAARATAREFAWPKVVRRHLLPHIEFYGGEPMRAAVAATLTGRASVVTAPSLAGRAPDRRLNGKLMPHV
jgi:glycosyltransferase involved in cell wall biosynthesis